MSELERPSLIIKEQTQSRVEFGYMFMRDGSGFKLFSKVDGGAFEINPENKTTVFSYYINPLPEILGMCVAPLFAFIEGPQNCFLCVFIAGMFVVRLIRVRMVAYRMMNEIVNAEE